MGLAGGWSGLAAEGSAWHWQQAADSLALLRQDQVIWKFQCGTNATKPCFHPLALPDGPTLTWDRPPDHRWHRALWFSWKYLNGVNYWEEDPKTGLAAGRTQWESPRLEARPDFSARITQALSYRPAQGKPVMTEARVIEVSAPRADGAYLMSWHHRFTALEDLVLDRTPLPDEPDGKPYGGYAGLSVRLAEGITDIRAVTADSPVTFAGGRFRGKSPALDYSGNFGGKEAGLAIFDHPQNLNAPSPWYVINDGPMHYFSPAVLCYQKQTLKTGQTLELRYGVLIHPGRLESASLKAAREAWLEKMK